MQTVIERKPTKAKSDKSDKPCLKEVSSKILPWLANATDTNKDSDILSEVYKHELKQYAEYRDILNAIILNTQVDLNRLYIVQASLHKTADDVSRDCELLSQYNRSVQLHASYPKWNKQLNEAAIERARLNKEFVSKTVDLHPFDDGNKIRKLKEEYSILAKIPNDKWFEAEKKINELSGSGLPVQPLWDRLRIRG